MFPLKRDENLEASLQAYIDYLVGDACEKLRSPSIGPAKYPTIWNGGPQITVMDGPFVGERILHDLEYKDTWKTVNEEGPSFVQLRKAIGCD